MSTTSLEQSENTSVQLELDIIEIIAQEIHNCMKAINFLTTQ